MAGTRNHRFTVVFERDEDGVWIAECIDLKSCCASGMTKDEAREKLHEVIAHVLDTYDEDDRSFEVAEYDEAAVATYIDRARKLKAAGIYDIEQYRKPGDTSNPSS